MTWESWNVIFRVSATHDLQTHCQMCAYQHLSVHFWPLFVADCCDVNWLLCLHRHKTNNTILCCRAQLCVDTSVFNFTLCVSKLFVEDRKRARERERKKERKKEVEKWQQFAKHDCVWNISSKCHLFKWTLTHFRCIFAAWNTLDDKLKAQRSRRLCKWT